MAFDEVHGRIRQKGEIEDAATAALKRWIEYYLGIVAEQHEFSAIAAPKRFAVVSEFERFPEDDLPVVIVMSEQAISVERKGDGYYNAIYPLSVAVVVAAASGPTARTMAHLYGAAVRALFEHNQSIGDGITVVSWEGDGSLTVGSAKARTTVAVEENFTVRMTNIVSDLAGPALAQPPEDPPTEWPEITDTEVDATHLADES